MIVVRNSFRGKFGKAKEVTDLFKQLMAIAGRVGFQPGQMRLLTDLAGEPFYTFVLETTHDSLAAFEQASKAVRSNAEWGALYKQLAPLIEEGGRKIYSIVD